MKTTKEKKDIQFGVRVSRELWEEFQTVANKDYQAPASQLIRKLMVDVVKQARKEAKQMAA